MGADEEQAAGLFGLAAAAGSGSAGADWEAAGSGWVAAV